MSFVNPLGLLLLTSLPIIVLLHLFRQERRRQEVSSLYLWREISDQHSRRMRPRLLRNVNLLLQLLAALAASLALAQPMLDVGTVAGARELIVMIDDSASMRAEADGVPRIELARNRAREVIGRAPRGAQIMIVTAGPRPAVVQTFTSDRTLLYEIVRAIEPTDGPNDLANALRLVRGLSAGDETDAVLITDGALTLDPDVALPPGFSVAPVVDPASAGSTGNRAITEFELRSRPDGTAFEVLAAVANYDTASAQLDFRLIADDEVISSRTVALDPDEERLITAVIPRTRGTRYTAELAGNEDALAVDDRAYAAAAGERPIRIQLVTGGNLFLESLLSVYPNVELTVTESVEQTRPFDILILDRVPAPARLRGNVVVFGTALPDGPFVAEGAASLERGVTTRAGHPLLRGVSLGEVQVGEVVTGTLNPRATVIASSGDIPLLYTYRTPNLTLVGTTFELTSSDLALRGSFPVLMHNIIQWLAPVSPSGDVGYAEVGEVVPLYVPPGEEIVVIRPDETAVRFTPRTSPFEFSDTDQSGLYEVRGESFRSHFAVSLTNRLESDLRPRRLAGVAGASDEVVEEVPGTPVWQWLALIAALLLVADWIVWARRH